MTDQEFAKEYKERIERQFALIDEELGILYQRQIFLAQINRETGLTWQLENACNRLQETIFWLENARDDVGAQ